MQYKGYYNAHQPYTIQDDTKNATVRFTQVPVNSLSRFECTHRNQFMAKRTLVTFSEVLLCLDTLPTGSSLHHGLSGSGPGIEIFSVA